MEEDNLPKTERVDLSFWYGKEGLKGKKKEMEEEEKQTDSGIMKIPVMTEKELVYITNKQHILLTVATLLTLITINITYIPLFNTHYCTV